MSGLEPDVVIRPRDTDYRFNREQYDALVEELQLENVSVEVDPYREGVGIDPTPETILAITVHIAAIVGDVATIVGIVAAAIKRHLRGARVGALSTVEIIGPDGHEVLARVKVDED